jgi:aldose 1-epimerase
MTAPTPAADGARTIRAGGLEAVFLPGRGMLGASLRHRGMQILRRIDHLEDAAAKGSTAGIPLLYPWANRLSGLGYRAAGRDVVLDPASPLLHRDENGLPMHGVPWPLLAWRVVAETPARLDAALDWDRADLLAVFPYRHRLSLSVSLADSTLTVETEVSAGAEGPVPVSFGFHPYVGLPGVARAAWRLQAPPLRRLGLDSRGIPDGTESSVGADDALLAARAFDDGYALDALPAAFTLSGGGRRVTVEMVEGFSHAQIYAPPQKDFVAIEPMMAPADALRSDRGLRVLAAGGSARAVFRIRVEDSNARPG